MVIASETPMRKLVGNVSACPISRGSAACTNAWFVVKSICAPDPGKASSPIRSDGDSCETNRLADSSAARPRPRPMLA
jgi:hypothetical protein